MSKDDTPSHIDEVLSEEELILLSASPEELNAADTGSAKMQSLRSKIMSQVDADAEGTIRERVSGIEHELLTIRADSGDWQEVTDKIRKKILHVDKKSGIETYLLKIEAGARDAPHIHSSDEHCIVLEGDVTFGDINLSTGDYHLAPEGSRHEEAHSVNGALLYIQTGIEQTVPV